MAANTALAVTSLDFDGIRTNLRNYIAAKPTFADYDFEDSALGTLLDLLAYNTYYNAYYASMAASESFIDSAQMFDSVASRAKLMGYTPTSARGATANVRITFSTAATPSIRTLTIAKNTKFTSVINSVSYTFVTPQSYTVVANSSNGFRSYVDLVEGFPLSHVFTYSTTAQSFVLPNVNADIASISVTALVNGVSSTFELASDITQIDNTSKVFFIEADRDGKYKVGFGDGVIGVEPDNNTNVTISYRVCNATKGNGATTFTAVSNVAGESSFTLTLADAASGGAAQEGIESVRFNAPKIFETQNRAVTAVDYQRIILRENQDLQAVSVWGGEENVPPIYGKVYATVKPIQGTLISSTRKEQIKTSLQKYNMQSINMEIVDPTFLYIIPTIQVQLDTTLTTSTASEVAAAVAARVVAYETNNLNRFGGNFRYSRFLAYLDDANDGITTTTADILLEKRFIPSITLTNTYTFKFNQEIINPLLSSAVSSTGYTFDGDTTYVDDDNSGLMRSLVYDGVTPIYTNLNIGTVDYDVGTIVLNSFAPVAITGDYIAIRVNPITQNFIPIRNQIILIAGATITIYDDKTNRQLSTINSVSTLGETTGTNETGITPVTTY